MALYPNGRAPASALVNIYGCVASPDMAKRVKYVKEEYDRTHSDNLIVNEIYRTYDEQVRQRQRWTQLGHPENAAIPGFSNHGDWDIGAVDWSSQDVQGRRNIAARVGLIHNIASESWHAAKIGTTSVALPELGGTSLAAASSVPIVDEWDEEDYGMATLYVATSGYDFVYVNWVFLEGDDGIFRPLSAEQLRDYQMAHPKAVIHRYAGADLYRRFMATGVYEWTDNGGPGGPIALTGRIIGRSADVNNQNGSTLHAFPPVRIGEWPDKV